MKCEDFKKYMADLCDKQTDPAITEACRQHMKECAACRAYYEDFMHTVNLLTPKYAPSFGKTQPVVSISPLQTTAKPKKHPSHKWIQIAAAVAIFMAGLGTGLSRGCSFHPPHFRPVYQEFTQCGQLLHVGLRPYYA